VSELDNCRLTLSTILAPHSFQKAQFKRFSAYPPTAWFGTRIALLLHKAEEMKSICKYLRHPREQSIVFKKNSSNQQWLKSSVNSARSD
jgi:hypothetical protein